MLVAESKQEENILNEPAAILQVQRCSSCDFKWFNKRPQVALVIHPNNNLKNKKNNYGEKLPFVGAAGKTRRLRGYLQVCGFLNM